MRASKSSSSRRYTRRCASPSSSRRCAAPSARSWPSPTAAESSCGWPTCARYSRTRGEAAMAPNGTPMAQQAPEQEEEQRPLERFGRDLTEAAEQGKLDPVIGRDEEIRRVIQVLSRRTKNNPVLIGEPGGGNTAIVEG